ncbi:MAG: glycosyltransferase [Lachnospiraceae bacterium]|nr:glycosyltransferase [Lachnospiraceae bacterium]
MSRYLRYIEQNERWRGRKTDRHIIDQFRARYDIIYDSDDHVPDPDALREFAKAAKDRDYDIIYCDEDVIRDQMRTRPYFKPDYSPETDRSLDYIAGMVALKKGRREDAQYVYPRDKVCHISKVLYHRKKERKLPKKKAAEESLFVDKSPGKISLIVLSKDHPDMFEKCVKSVTASLSSDDAEMILVDNGSSQAAGRRYKEISASYGINYYYFEMDFNFSELNNYAVSKSTGKVLIFINDDIEVPVTEKGIFERMAAKAMEEDTGAVGIKLLYPGEERIQHCGIGLLYSGPSHKLQGYKDDRYYYGWSDHDINTIAVTGACLAVRRDRFDKAGGFDPGLPVAYNDVDLCLRLYEQGFYNVCMNSHHLIHSEGATRTDDRKSRQAYERLKGERIYLISKHGDMFDGGDPFLNKNLSPYSLDFEVNLPAEWEKAGMSETGAAYGRMKKGNHIHAALDSFEYKISDAYGNEDFYEIRGWIFKEGLMNMRPCVVLEADGRFFVVSTAKMRRTDVGEVFSKHKKSVDSGFVARIPARDMEKLGIQGTVTAFPALMGRRGSIYRSDEECMRKAEI